MVSGSNSGKNCQKKRLRKSKKKGRREPSELFFVLMSRHWLHAVTKTLMYHTTTTTSSSLPTAIGSMFDPLEKSANIQQQPASYILHHAPFWAEDSLFNEGILGVFTFHYTALPGSVA